MVEVGSVPGGATARRCVCCGDAVATRSIPACWDHWRLLPEDLQSAIIKTTGLGRLAEYGRHLLEAIRIWRRAGAWRAKGIYATSGGDLAPKATILAARTIAELLQLSEQSRRTTIRQVKAANRRSDLSAGRDRPDRGFAGGRNDRPMRPAFSFGYRSGNTRLGPLDPWCNDNAPRPGQTAKPKPIRPYARPSSAGRSKAGTAASSIKRL
jgi:hypothetical protein